MIEIEPVAVSGKVKTEAIDALDTEIEPVAVSGKVKVSELLAVKLIEPVAVVTKISESATDPLDIEIAPVAVTAYESDAVADPVIEIDPEPVAT